MVKNIFCVILSLGMLCVVVRANGENPASAPEDSAPLWSIDYRVHGKDHPVKLLSRPDGGWYIVGWSGWHDAGAQTGKGWKETWWVLEVDALGGQQRRFEFDGRTNYTQVWDATLNGDEIVVVGTAWMARVGLDGKLISTTKLRDGSDGSPTPKSILPTSDGHLVLAGEVSRGKDKRDAWLAKLTSSGEVVWSKSLDRGADEVAFGLVLRPDGGMILAVNSGHYNKLGLGPSALWLLHCSPSGEKLADMVVEGARIGLPTRDCLVAWEDGIAASYVPSRAPEPEVPTSVVARISPELQVMWSKASTQQRLLSGMIDVDSNQHLLVLTPAGSMKALVLTTLDKDGNTVTQKGSSFAEILLPVDIVARDDGVFVLGIVTRRWNPVEQTGHNKSARTPEASHEYDRLSVLVRIQ